MRLIDPQPFRPERPGRPASGLGFLHRAKWSFVTRRVGTGDAAGLSDDIVHARPGDLVLAEVARIGNHKRLQLGDGRFSPLYVGDRVVVACGDRFAADQFEGRAALSLTGADLLAGGGVAGQVISRNARIGRATQLTVLGLLCDAMGNVMNVADVALPERTAERPRQVIGVFGTGMNAGKTAAAAGLINGFARLGARVAAIKATGTGAFGDVQQYEAAGAETVLDFTDAGMASTHRQPIVRLVRATETLLAHASACDVAVVELADGVSQVETAGLLSRPGYAALFDGTILAAPDAMAARGGLGWLAEHGITPLALTGLITRAPLSAQEAENALGLPVLSREALSDPATASAFVGLLGPAGRSAA